MDIKKAISHWEWRLENALENNYPIKVSDKDLESYNAIGKYIEQTQENQFRDNELFAKLYIYLFTKSMEFSKSNVFDNDAQNRLLNVLKMPTEKLIENLQKSMNDSEVYFQIDEAKVKDGIIPEGLSHIDTDYLDQLIEIKDPSEKAKFIKRWKDEKKMQYNKWDSLYRENPDACLGNVWEYETVKNNITLQVNAAINYFKR